MKIILYMQNTFDPFLENSQTEKELKIEIFNDKNIKSDKEPDYKEEKIKCLATLPDFANLDNLEWKEIHIELRSKDSIFIKARNFSQTFHYVELGFLDRRKRDLPNTLWEMIVFLAENNGEISWSTPDVNVEVFTVKKFSLLRKRLKELFKIEDNPFYPYRPNRAYKVKFVIKDCRPSFH